MVKQVAQFCICGKEVNLPDGEVKTTCSCGRSWEISTEGVLLTNLMFPFCQEDCSQKIVPIVAKRVRNKRRRKAMRCSKQSAKN